MDERVVTTPERRLSFAFAKRHGVVVTRFVDGVAECAVRTDTSPLAIAEVRRYLRTSMKLDRVEEPVLDLLLRTTCAALPPHAAPTRRCRRPRVSSTPPISPILRKTCRRTPTSSRARTTRRSSG